MTMTTSTTEICSVCKRPRQEHIDRGYRHQFVPIGGPVALVARDESPSESSPARTSESQGHVRMIPGGDPVLRMALIRKGLLTPDDLTSVEDELRATGVIGHDPESMGESGGR